MAFKNNTSKTSSDGGYVRSTGVSATHTSKLPENERTALLRAGISSDMQNAWFWPHTIGDKEYGCDWEYRPDGGVILHCGNDFNAAYINDKFAGALWTAYGDKWRVVGHGGLRAKGTDNPEYGPYQPVPKNGNGNLRDELQQCRDALRHIPMSVEMRDVLTKTATTMIDRLR